MSDNPFILSNLPPIDFSNGAVPDFSTPVPEPPRITEEEWDSLFGESVSVGSILIRLYPKGRE
jgi:hypothetical protein